VGFGLYAREAAPGIVGILREAGVDEGTVVDLGCGSGILLQALGGAGYATVGIDPSPAMLKLARAAKKSGLGLRTQWPASKATSMPCEGSRAKAANWLAR